MEPWLIAVIVIAVVVLLVLAALALSRRGKAAKARKAEQAREALRDAQLRQARADKEQALADEQLARTRRERAEADERLVLAEQEAQGRATQAAADRTAATQLRAKAEKLAPGLAQRDAGRLEAEQRPNAVQQSNAVQQPDALQHVEQETQTIHTTPSGGGATRA